MNTDEIHLIYILKYEDHTIFHDITTGIEYNKETLLPLNCLFIYRKYNGEEQIEEIKTLDAMYKEMIKKHSHQEVVNTLYNLLKDPRYLEQIPILYYINEEPWENDIGALNIKTGEIVFLEELQSPTSEIILIKNEQERTHNRREKVATVAYERWQDLQFTTNATIKLLYGYIKYATILSVQKEKQKVLK